MDYDAAVRSHCNTAAILNAGGSLHLFTMDSDAAVGIHCKTAVVLNAPSSRIALGFEAILLVVHDALNV